MNSSLFSTTSNISCNSLFSLFLSSSVLQLSRKEHFFTVFNLSVCYYCIFRVDAQFYQRNRSMPFVIADVISNNSPLPMEDNFEEKAFLHASASKLNMGLINKG